MSTTIPAVPFKQHKIQMYLAAVPPDYLDLFSIDIWDPKNVAGRRGYQRTPDERRIKSIAKYLERRSSIMPVAGLLNVRDKGRLKFRNGQLTIPDGVKIWVVDMQHRLKGLLRAREEDGLTTSSFSFPVVITEGLSQVDEAVQFYLINTKAKKMDVALTRRLLIENNKVKDIADVKPWEIAAVRITIELNKEIRGNGLEASASRTKSASNSILRRRNPMLVRFGNSLSAAKINNRGKWPRDWRCTGMR
jgi:DGQHR domain-containing protein